MATKMLPAIQTILNAIDAPNLIMLTGAHRFEQINSKTVRFRLPAYVANKQINRVTISVNEHGTYSIQFSRKTKVNGVSTEAIIDTRAPLLSPNLRSCIGTVTGLIVDKFDTTL